MAMDVFYASHFGHAAQIARALADNLAQAGIAARPRDLAKDYPSEAEIVGRDPCVLIAAIRYGFHLASARRLLKRLGPLTPWKPVVLLSVSLSARKPNRRSVADNPYLSRWIRRSHAHPLLAEGVAGKLEYPRYNPFDRTMIRLIMTMTGGPTDGTSTIDYTDWGRLAALAVEIGELLGPMRDRRDDDGFGRD